VTLLSPKKGSDLSSLTETERAINCFWVGHRELVRFRTLVHIDHDLLRGKCNESVQKNSIVTNYCHCVWQAVSFNSDGVGLAVGEKGALAVTTDNGKTWQLQETGIQDDLRVVRLRGPHAVILGAKKAYSINVSSTGQRDGQ
jgi:hypothetical protein